jgi:hypothetical protein
VFFARWGGAPPPVEAPVSPHRRTALRLCGSAGRLTSSLSIGGAALSGAGGADRHTSSVVGGVLCVVKLTDVSGGMFSGFLLAASAVLTCLLLVCCQRWAYICLCAFVEVIWVGLAYLFGALAVRLNENLYLFWAMVGLFFSAVELCLALFLFIILSDFRGAAGEAGL